MIKIKNLSKILTFTLFLNFLVLTIPTFAEELEVHTGTLVMDEYQTFNGEVTMDNLYSNNAVDELIKTAIYNGLKNVQPTIDLSRYCMYMNNDLNMAANLFFKVLAEHPDIFYCTNSISYSYSLNYNNQIVGYSLLVKYAYDTPTINTMKVELNDKVSYIKNNLINDSYSELKKEFIVHDYLTQNCTYDAENLSKNTVPAISHTAYGALVNKVAVCDGYSKAAKLLLNECGVECGVIVSDQMHHAWNYVKIDGEYYQLDITWDDPVPESNRLNYSYFNLTNAEMAKSHQWVQSDYPVGTSSRFGYLRTTPSYQLTRLDDRLYYVNSKKLLSSNLEGEDIKTEVSKFTGSNLVGYDNYIYSTSYTWFVPAPEPTYKISKLNLKDNTSEDVFTFDGRFSTMYLKDNKLNVEYTSNGVNSTKLIDLPEAIVKDVRDLNNDGEVDVLDLSLVASKYNLSSSDNDFKAEYDLNNNAFIDIFDLVPISKAMQ
ncbi:transglutaminase domain-containing protein [Clostridium chauvoei]|uniref:Transglutaminase-like domain-containing protein n=2 Tax=Clostridium chauvoei TaxID=46867 RepID=S6EI53_9CLOT|nr:transglutaminase domain-containing protein [Clostridium chauvoei]ATD54273.1 hypothetical protein BTM20_03085 [Clostridium chauvoei]ATD58045.1 hypothetical protein BTM21_09985 [Clostridium chauvoei]MBX7279880.1 hypothetical protein [Clostridium chauvoei]MBX7282202.1 hypothetical protein [Clostridium chauvoei]MBX7284770.1 hypothetical protein [Clostridium chauvoei]